MLESIKTRTIILPVTIALVVTTLWQFNNSYGVNQQRQNSLIVDAASNILDTVEQNSIFFSAGDSITGPLWYLQTTGERPDVRIVDVNLLAQDWYIENEMKRNADVFDSEIITLGGPDAAKKRLLYVINKNITQRPLYGIINPDDPDIKNGFDFWPIGLTHKITAKNSLTLAEIKKLNDGAWGRYKLRNLESDFYSDSMDKQIVELYSLMLNNLGTIYAKAGLKNEAKELLKKAIEINPHNQTAKKNFKKL